MLVNLNNFGAYFDCEFCESDMSMKNSTRIEIKL